MAGVRGLSGDDVQAIRDGLAAGRKPRVQFTEAAGQIAGQIGQVVELTDPVRSEEWVVVRFGRDELPFSPGDLRPAPRGAALRRAARASAPPAPPQDPEFVLDKPPGSGVARRAGPGAATGGGVVQGGSPAKAGVQAKAARAVHGGSPAKAGVQAKAARAVHGDSRAKAGDEGEPGGKADERAPRKGDGEVVALAARKAARTGKAKPPAALTVTLAYGAGEWTVAAAQGAKVLAKPYVVRPAEALRMVSLVDVPGVREAVEQILAAERAGAQREAQRLRAELAEIEARLAELGEVG